jgi:N-acetylglutamate synthase-like GNAT family acetyltransferase
MTHTPAIRKGKLSDIPQLAKLYTGVKEIADFAGQKHDRAYFLSCMKTKSGILLIAEQEGKICGALNADFDDIAKYTFLDNIVVAKDCRGQGVGRQLFRKLETESKKRGNKRIFAFVYTWNKNMHKVMKRYDYVPSGKTVIYFKKL